MSDFVIRSLALNGFAPVVEELGGNPQRYCEQLQLPPISELQQQEFIDYRIMIDLWNLAARDLQCPHFGYLVSQRKQPQHQFGVFPLVVATSSTVDEALHCFARFLKVHSKTGVSELHTEGNYLQWSHTIHYPDHVDLFQVYLHAMGIGLKILNTLSGGKIKPHSLHFIFKESEEYQPLKRAFGVPISFNDSWNGVLLKRDDLNQPLPRFDAQIKANIEKELEGILSESRHDFVLNMKTIIGRAIDIGDPTIDRVATYLNCNKRTLQRRLKHWQLSYKTLLDELRLFRAKDYLQYSTLSLIEISELLAYNDQSSFSRFFTQQVGESPNRWRQRHDTHSG